MVSELRPHAVRSESTIAARKDDHLDIVLAGGGMVASARTGLERYRFTHVALPEMALDDVDLTTPFLGRRLKAPLLISSMTGGPKRAAAINRHLAEAAEHLGIAFAVGSQRIAIETDASIGLGPALRRTAPSVPLLANLGAAQICGPGGLDAAHRAVDMIEADALIIHLNPLQEALQPEGDRDWRGVLDRIAVLCRSIPVPVVAKEVGAGIAGDVARLLADAGVAAIDVAGAGGTSWAAVEAHRAQSGLDREVAMAFADWGIPTADAIVGVRQTCPSATVIASGGIRNGIDAAKAIALGADLVGQAAALLDGATLSTEAVVAHFDGVVRQLRTACFCTGSSTPRALAARLELR